MQRPQNSSRAGFTLIEILAVMLVIGILFTFLMRSGMFGVKSVEIKQTQTFLQEVTALVDDYKDEFGTYPPSTFAKDVDPKPSKLNGGIESLVLTLWRSGRGWQARDIDPDRLCNTDGDRAKGVLSFGEPDAFELMDVWENPIAYIRRQDYGKSFTYLVLTEAEGEIESVVQAYESPKTGDFYRKNTFQLISAGPDGEFMTDDDIANFEIED